MRAAALLLLAAAAPPPEPTVLGIYGRWGAFAAAEPTHCYAIAQPVETVRGATGRPFASIATWPGRRTRNQLHVRLSRQRRADAAIILSVGERRFTLTGGAVDGWSPDAATDRAIVTALRGNRSMSVESVGADGRSLVDVYQLSGAATAIDAAALACRR